MLRRLSVESGFALVIALGASVALGMAGTSVVAYTAQNYGQSSRSKADQTALALAEAGLNDAYSTLYAASNPSMSSAVPSAPVPEIQADGGTITYYGSYDSANKVWTLTGIGRVRNPTGVGAVDVVRRVTGRARLGNSTQGTANNAIWNYVYADSLTTCTSLTNSVDINVPLYVRGNLCLNNSAQVSGYALQVGGTVTFGNTSHAGSATEPMHEAHIRGGCSVSGGDVHSPCGSADRVFATISDNQPTGLTKPPVDLAGWYQNAMPGPLHGCTIGTFPGGFDNDTVMNHSLPGTVDLTPSQAYDCKVLDAGGQLVGRIAWTGGSTGTLTVLGTIFFDGDIEFRNQTNAVYQGKATIYSSGTITLSNHTTLCGVAGCGTNWDPTTNLLAFVAGGVDRYGVGFSVQNNTTYQGAIYAVGDYFEDNAAVIWGPIIANQLGFSNSSTNFYVPIGTPLPGMPATYETVNTVTNEPGSWTG